MVDAVVSVFLEKLLGALSEGGRILIEFRDQFEILQNKLLLMQSFLKDAERLKRKNQTLRQVMSNLRETVYQAEDMLADCQLNYSDPTPPKWLNYFSDPSRITFRFQFGNRLKEMNAKIAGIEKDITTYVGPPSQLVSGPNHDQILQWRSPEYDHTKVVGLEDDTMKLKEWLVEGDNSDGILSIGVVGMGGLGKTTVAEKVFNEHDIEERFEKRIWVVVSQSFTPEQILRSMLRNLGDASLGDDASELLKKINQYLTGKRFLIVVDDVWDGFVACWNNIRDGLPKGNGSGVIITTRSSEVAERMNVKETRMHRPECLNTHYSQLLFRTIAFARTGGTCDYPEIEKVGDKIVDKCKGLPLAIKAVGGVMLYKASMYTEWNRILNNFHDELAEIKDDKDSVYASLQLSYDELPSYLKSCFLCLSLFPEDCVVTKDQLIHWWIGEGFVPIRGGRSAIEAGEDCFAGLTNRCLLEVAGKTYYGAIDACKTHDMVRDLVVRIAVQDEFSTQNHGSITSVRHVSLDSPISLEKFPANNKLRALISTTKTGELNRVSSSIAKRLCIDAHYLRAMDLSRSIFNAYLSTLLAKIGALQHLTYLGLSNTHPLVHLPESIKQLKNLQILDVSYCQNLKSIPAFIITFKKLRVLDVNHCGSLEFLPKGLGRLSALEVLLGFKPANPSQEEGCRIGEIRNLIKLRKLGLHLTRSDEISDSEINTLLNLQELQHLSINCYESYNDEGADDVAAKLDKLFPPQQLHELSMRFLPGRVSPAWLNPVSLPMLRYLSLRSGNLAKMSEDFWGCGENTASLWRIEGVLLESLSEFEEDWERVKKVMPSLRVVSASWCPELVSFPVRDIGFRGGVWKKEDHTKTN